jgi:hypothetical protein
MADARIQARIDFLKKNRPNDPEIKQLQKKLASTPAAPAPEQPAAPVDDGSAQAARQQERIDYLQKNRPGDPEIKELQKKLGGGQQGGDISGISGMGDPAATPPGTPAPEVPAEPLPKVAVDYASDIAADSGVNQAFTPELTDRPLDADLNQARLQQQQELETYLGRDIDSAYEKARKQQEQQLFNRGIPVGSEQYADSMKMLDDNFARQKGDIRAQSLQYGGQELERTFRLGEDRRAGELDEQLTTNKTNMGNVGSFADIDLAYKQLAEQRRQANQNASLTRAQLAKQGGGGGGGRVSTSTPIVESPFVG